ncbi:TPA: hypothetical protein EYP27_00970 [Candidatus Bathyarchaeota archaeon]|nr:hypothetical protein [Candidatus Bathyarchaeota archaeon]
MKLSVTELFPCRLNSEFERVCLEFRRMVDWWMGKAAGMPQLSHQQLRDAYSPDWRRVWGEDFSVLYGQTSCMLAWSLHRQYGRVEYGQPLVVLNPLLIRKIGLPGLTITVNRRKHVNVEVEAESSHQKVLLEQAETGRWRPGQAILSPKWILLTLTTTINPASKETPEIEALLKKGAQPF